VIRAQTILWIAAFALLTCSANAQRASGLSADLPNSKTLAIQAKVDDLFDAGKFERAYFIYRHELVPLGDKYAQYMVGYMHLSGKGVDEDTIAASAWYRLAAERHTPEFVAVRDQLLRNMSEDEMHQSDILYLELRRKFCDLAVVLASIKRNREELEPKTGSPLENSSSSLTLIETSVGARSRSGADSYGRINRRLLERVQLLLETGEFPELGNDPAQIDLDVLERLVREKVESGPD